MAIKGCFDCKGEMKKPNPIHSYDFNKDGWIPFYCIDCGLCSDSEKIITTHVIYNVLGHRFIERVLEKICNEKLRQDYVFKKEVLKLLKQKVFSEVDALSEEIASHCHGRGYPITEDYILKIIYSELDYSSFVQFPVTSP